LHQQVALEQIGETENDEIDENKFIPSAFAHGINQPDGNDEEQIRHVFNGNSFGAVAQHGEHGKQPEGGTQAHLHFVEQVGDEEDEQVENEKREKIFSAFMRGKIDETDEDNHGCEVDSHPHEKFWGQFLE
jgi:hypothetical protein